MRREPFPQPWQGLPPLPPRRRRRRPDDGVLMVILLCGVGAFICALALIVLNWPIA